VTLAELGGFLAISALLIVIPGPDMALVARNALRGGRRSGFATSIGVFAGLVVWTIAASVGLAAMLRASEPAFVTLKICGCVYLVYLGARSLLDALRGTGSAKAARQPNGRGSSVRISLRQGLISNLGNPKIAVFFTSFLPQFVPARHSPFLALLALGLVFCVLTLAWLAVYSALVARAGDLLRRSSVRRALDGVTGAVLVGLGARLALERRA
jgi:threonine/homoserine/homoserine lactone efflux protein